ncbi:S-adenosyl-L-methionine-dependent methyltransferase [Rhizophagus irregularis]|uniref:S-adenosyl-L-methionine-dependent methyltransferase n=1 Tax=Rhizophagus irregularis TaxID=588596 RepID=A0A2N1NFT0_9GLOM|nr:S-adenosyl-L-methionine-dependent methyltransferase [Rhizophagus irregularis]
MDSKSHNKHLHPLEVTEENESTAILDTHRYVNGRRFHNVTGVEYFMPNDEQEISRLEMSYLLVKYLWQNNFSSPIHEKLTNENMRVIDIGCGTGKWSLEMAEMYPKVTFIGIDISTVFPTETKFSNVTFFLANVLDGLPFEKNTFDFVFQRFLTSSYTNKQWEKVINELIRILKPGGYLELMEKDNNWISIGPSSKILQESFLKLLGEKDINPSMNLKIEQLLKDSNQLIDINIETKDILLGSPGGIFGELTLKNQLEAFDHMIPYLSSYMELSIKEFKNKYLDTIPMEVNKYKTCIKCYRHWGRKI